MFCNTNETCKILIVLFVMFLAGYLIATNDVSKRLVREQFANEETKISTSTGTNTQSEISIKNQNTPPKDQTPQEKVLSKQQPKGTENVQKTPTKQETNDIKSSIQKVYREVYFQDIAKDKLEKMVLYLNSDNYDECTLKRAFEIERTSELQEMIRNIFIDVIAREPTPEEMNVYVKQYLSNEMKTGDELIRILQNSPEQALLKKAPTTIPPKDKKLTKQDYEQYKQIIEVFQNTLDRSPNAAELNFYFNLSKKDNAFTLAKLRDTLLMSREFEILSKNQRNVVFGELEANITEKQLEMTIVGIYQSIYLTKPDPFAYKYIRQKFIDFNLDEDKLILFVKKLKSAEEEAKREAEKREAQSKDTRAPYSSGPVKETTTTTTTTTTSRIPVKGETKNNKELYEHFVEKPKSLYGYVTEHYEDDEDDDGEQRSVNVYTKTATSTESKILSADRNPTSINQTVENIKESGKCEFDKNKLEKILELNQRQLYADYLNDRNVDKCKFRTQQSKYLNTDENLVLYPEFKWEVPMKKPPVCYSIGNKYQPSVEQTALIGTLLKEAEDTEVGSIMPKFDYNENIKDIHQIPYVHVVPLRD